MVSEKSKQNFYFALCFMSMCFSVMILLFVLFYIIKEGFSVISFEFLTSMWSHREITQGGILPAIIGTVYLALGIAIFSIPVGVATAIYLNEYAKESVLNNFIRLAIRNLAGVPSIIYGLFGLAFFVLFLNLGTSLIAASFTLACLTLPWIITASDEAIKSIPQSFREASYALGATKSQTIVRVILPNSLSGMITGSILGISRAIGETAPLILVGATFYISYLPSSPTDKFMALPYHIFILATQHSSVHAKEFALGTALVLIFIVFFFNLGAFILRYKIRKAKVW